jgi:methionine-rich copper-binding protein CopC
MMKVFLGGLVFAALVAGAAQAHPKLLAANPAANARIASPAEIRLTYSETLIGKFSQISLADGAGKPVPLGASQLSPDRKQLTAAVKGRLAPGTYTVTWRAVSTDTHKVQGGYAFQVAP